MDPFSPIYYTVLRIDGDYAVLVSEQQVENRVARALLPPETDEGSVLKYELLQYSIIDPQK